MKERDPAWGNHMMIQILGRPKSGCELNGKAMVQKTQTCWTRLTSVRWEITWTCFSTFTEIGIRRLVITHTWQEEKVRLGTPTSPKQETRIEAVRSFFDGGVSTVCDDKIKNKVGSAYVIQIVEKLRKTQTR